MRLHRLLLAVVFLACLTRCFSDREREQAAAPKNWEAVLTPLVRYPIDYLSVRHDTLTILWSDQFIKSPFAYPLTLDQLQHDLVHVSRVQPDTVADLPCLRLTTSQSIVYWSPADSNVLQAVLQEEHLALSGSVQVGMSKAAFLQLYFTQAPAYLHAIHTVEFYSGVGENTTYYTFAHDRLSRIWLLQAAL
jgi:hypothetical protein